MNHSDRSNSRLFDRSSYSDTTISVYNIISSYFVHIYYNTLYQTAVSLKAKGVVPNITLGYRDRILTFVNVIDSKCKKYYKKENYSGILDNLRKEFETWTNCDTLTLTECINKIVREFVPGDFFDSIGKDQRRNILSIVLIGALRNFNHHVSNQYMKMIIDNHDDTDNVVALTEKFVDCLIEERQKLYMQFMNSESKQSEKIDKKYVDMMRCEIAKLNDMCKKFENENKQLQQSLHERVEQLSKVIKKARKNEERAHAFENELNTLKTQLNYQDYGQQSRQRSQEQSREQFNRMEQLEEFNRKEQQDRQQKEQKEREREQERQQQDRQQKEQKEREREQERQQREQQKEQREQREQREREQERQQREQKEKDQKEREREQERQQKDRSRRIKQDEQAERDSAEKLAELLELEDPIKPTKTVKKQSVKVAEESDEEEPVKVFKKIVEKNSKSVVKRVVKKKVADPEPTKEQAKEQANEQAKEQAKEQPKKSSKTPKAEEPLKEPLDLDFDIVDMPTDDTIDSLLNSHTDNGETIALDDLNDLDDSNMYM